MVELSKGGNVRLGAAGAGGMASVVVGLRWESGGLECDPSALVCDSDRQVLSDEHFLFWSNPAVPTREVFLRTRAASIESPDDMAQVMVATQQLDASVDRVVLVLSTLVEGATLSALERLEVRVWDPTTGLDLASYTIGREFTVETCAVVGEIYRHRDDWKFRAVGQGYHTGLAGLGTDFGVNIAG